MITTLLATVFVLGVLIIFHELGHYLAARKVGVKVERFSVGFGPVIFRIKRKETEYTLSLIPLGGYVKLAGESREEAKGKEDEFYSKPCGMRMFIVAAGPFMSFFLGFLIFFFTFSFGYPVIKPVVGKVLPDYPAQAAGLKPGDLIVKVQGRKIDSWEKMASIIRRSGNVPLSLEVMRAGKNVRITVVPAREKTKDIWGKEVEVPVIGITPSGDYFVKRDPPWTAFYLSARKTLDFSIIFLKAIGKLIVGQVSFKQLGGPILIAQMAGEEARQGFLPLVLFAAFISINLGVVNLIPLPVLDGGYIFLLFLEKIRRRPISKKVEMVLQQVGIALLIFLMLMVTYNDIARWKERKAREKVPADKSGKLQPGR
ncbi:MAG: RIP metalloprotease RseP [Caldiserica bacterium]|nr:RIP metalloprotease RseP [Caldisericota bacterium]